MFETVRIAKGCLYIRNKRALLSMQFTFELLPFNMVPPGVAVCLLLTACFFSASADTPWNGYGGRPVHGVYPPPQYPVRYGLPYPLHRETLHSVNNEPEDVDTDEDANPSSSLVGSLLSFIPGGLSGILSLSSGSFRSKRSLLNPETQADFVDYVLEKKKELVSGIARDAIFYAHRKKPVAIAWLKDSLYSLLSGTPSYESISYAPISDYDLSQPSQYPVLIPDVSYGVPPAPVPVPSYGVPPPAQLYPYPGEHLAVQQFSDDYDSEASNLKLSRQYRHNKEDGPAATGVETNENGIATTETVVKAQ